MQTNVHFGALRGIEALLTDAEVDVSAGLRQMTTERMLPLTETSGNPRRNLAAWWAPPSRPW